MIELAKHRALGIFLGALAVALLFYQELFIVPSSTGYGDYQFFHHNWEFGRIAISRYGELPLWNPYYCGGIPDFGDPQTQLHHPLFFASFLFGTTIALKLFVVAHATAGLCGMYVYARRIQEFAPAPAVLAAGAWAGSGFFAWHCGCGHGGFVAFYLLPWLLVAWRASVADFRFSAAVAALLVLSLLAGGAYVFPYLLLVLAFDAIVLARLPSQRRGIAITAVTSGLLTLLLGAWRLIPILVYLRYYGRQRETFDRLRLSELIDALTRNAANTPIDVAAAGHPYSWVEYGAFVGWGVLLLALAGAVLAVRAKSHRSLVLGATLFGSLTLGSFTRFAPWNLLHAVPIYRSLQAPSRFAFACLFFIALLAAFAVDRALARLAQTRLSSWRPYRLLGFVAVLALLVPIALHHRGVLAGKWKDLPVPRMAQSPEFFLTVLPGQRKKAVYPPGAGLPAANIGTAACYTGMDYRPATGLWIGPSPQARVPPPASVQAWGRTTRSVWADVDMPLGGSVVFNQTYAPGWSSDFGPPSPDEMRTSIEVPPGRRRVVLRYDPPSLPWALAGSLVGLCLALTMTSRKIGDFVMRRRWRLPVLVVAFATFALVAYQRGVFAG